ncbi:MAG: NTP transferase domain-containing protein [Muribaculaceae bacterium]|nr:NTP transferase domain-containing protein [Muribaculaceae bacterium]
MTIGMIFAAGLGTRLKPFTLHHPKAMVEVDGHPMLRNVIDRMTSAGINDIVVNVHHFAEQIIDYLNVLKLPGVKFYVSDESDQLLDTGGGLLKVCPLLEQADCVVSYNADVWCDLDLDSFIAIHSQSKADVTLAVAERKSSRALYFNEDHRLCGWQNLSTRQMKPDGFSPTSAMLQRAYSGIQAFVPGRVLPQLAEYSVGAGPVFSIIPFYLAKLEELDIKGYDLSPSVNWFDVGKPETLAEARAFAAID